MRIYSKRVVDLIGVSSRYKTKLFSIFFALIFFMAIFAYSALSSVSIASDITNENIMNLTNWSRNESGRQSLAVNSKLAAAAEAKAEDMISGNYFSHTSPSGVTPWKWIEKENYDYNYAGENLAMDFHSAEKMEESWMASPTHRANILNKEYSDIGVAVKEGFINGHDTIIAVVMFGSGDKNISSARSAKENTETEDITMPAQPADEKKTIPVLPKSEQKNIFAIDRVPVITNPQTGSELSDSNMEINGQAKPGESVRIFDNGNEAASAVANQDGWFSTVLKNVPEGVHKLAAGSQRQIFESVTTVTVDREKPRINFYVYADNSNSNRFILEADTNERNCLFRFNGETKKADAQGKALFSIGSEKSSAILRVQDPAGNKNFSQVMVANYYSPEYKNNISKTLVLVLSARKNIFTTDSGRRAIQNNLNIAMGGI